ncbi:MAG: class C sortase [Eggerthellales bacterium]|nr:class C sortase [Eggerthellales bacterium]
MASYNESLASGEVTPAADPFSFQEAEDQFNGKGLQNGLVGFIKIPAMKCNMPLYLGSSYEHMALGATVVGGTSAPIGGESTNCAIAAHRGWQTSAMFRDIETLKKGDKVIIGNPWETMEYQVTKIRVIDPSDTDAIAIQPGRDLVSLLTCHPYGYNYSRYLVICERVDADSVAIEADANEDSGIAGELSLVQVEDVLRIVGLAGIAICAVLLIMRLRKQKKNGR